LDILPPFVIALRAFKRLTADVKVDKPSVRALFIRALPSISRMRDIQVRVHLIDLLKLLRADYFDQIIRLQRLMALVIRTRNRDLPAELIMDDPGVGPADQSAIAAVAPTTYRGFHEDGVAHHAVC